MSDESERTRIYIGNFEPGVHVLTIPAAAIQPAVAAFDAERRNREQETARAKLRIMQDVRGKTRLRKALMLCFGFKRARRSR
jgi:hypothetical protein